jgi:hypothetical protein
VLGGAGRGANRRGRDAGRAVFRQHDRRHAGRIGRAEQRADILRVFDVIENQHHGVGILFDVVRHLIERNVRIPAGAHRHALVVAALAALVQLVALRRPERHAPGQQQGAQFGHLGRVAPGHRQQRLVQVTLAGLHHLQHRPAAVNPVTAFRRRAAFLRMTNHPFSFHHFQF